MAYEYDIFLSYSSKHELSKTWIKENFIKFFVHDLDNELPYKSKIFEYSTEISTGASWWKETLKALSTSKCMVSIWNPEYFRSPYCKKELSHFLFRETQLKIRSIENPHGIVFPIKLHDGQHFPNKINGIQFLDWTEYTTIGEYFLFHSQNGCKFQDMIKLLAKQIANSLLHIPNWNSVWLERDWLERSITELYTELDICNPYINQPIL